MLKDQPGLAVNIVMRVIMMVAYKGFFVAYAS
jgi:hypothetical protein